MSVNSTFTRSGRIGNETSLSGSQALSSQLGESVNQEIADGADDTVVAIGDFTKDNFDGMILTSDEDVTAKVLGGNPRVVVEIVTLGDMATNVGGTFTVADDQTEWIYPGDQFYIQGSTTAANDGRYYVINSTFAAGVTTIEVIRQLGVINVAAIEVFDTAEAGAGVDHLAFKIIPVSVKNNITAGDDFTANNTIEVAGDFSSLQADDKILIEEATTAGNDIVATVVTAVFATPDTTIVVEETAFNVEVGNANCTFQHVQTELLMHLTANEPFMWSKDSGVINPVLEDITEILITNTSGSSADVQARIIKSSP